MRALGGSKIASRTRVGVELFNKIETPGDGLMIRGMQDRSAASINIVSANNFIRALHSLYHSRSIWSWPNTLVQIYQREKR
jgi:hypothetical protein